MGLSSPAEGMGLSLPAAQSEVHVSKHLGLDPVHRVLLKITTQIG